MFKSQNVILIRIHPFIEIDRKLFAPIVDVQTTIPLGAVDHSNLYQYVFNNPYRY